jgi:plastocyanin domain-containing protein
VKTILIAVASVLVMSCQTEKPAAEAAPQRVVSATDNVRTIAIKVSGGEYQPATVNVKKGEPVRLQFTRDEKPTCGDVLVIPSLNIKETIPVNEVVSIDITPDKAGDLEFTCGMNMLKGKIVVQ